MSAGIPPLLAPPFRFDMGLRRGNDSFFCNCGESALLAERNRWLDAHPARHAAALPGSDALLAEVIEFVRALNPAIGISAGPAVLDKTIALGRFWEPDFLLLEADGNGRLTLRAACVCFPTHWALAEKMGQPVAAIHGAAPTLNASLGTKIDSFLATLRPGVIWERWNWGLAATTERNDHPARNLPRLDSGATLDRTWLRFERQAFTGLRAGVLFGIRIGFERLDTLAFERARQLADLLESMSPEIATYKGVASSRSALARQLRATAPGETPCPNERRL